MSVMNFKAQLGKKIHKLPSGLNSFEELLFVVRTIFSQKLPEQYTFKYEDSDKDWIGLESQEDFEAAIGFFKENNINSMKIKIVKSSKPALDQYVVKNLSDELSQSRIIQFSKIEGHEDLNESIVINKDQKKQENKQDEEVQNEVKPIQNEVVAVVEEQNNKEKQAIEKENDEKNQIQQIERNSEVVVNNIQENQKVLELNSQQKIQLTYEELHKMIEDVVEQKIKTLLSNYDLVPKQQQRFISSQEYLNKLNEINQPNLKDNQEEKKEDFRIKEEQNSSSNNDLNSSKISESQLQESRKPKALLKTDPPAELNVEVGSPYVWSFKIENSGITAWPKYTYFKCLQGPHKDQKMEIEQLQPSGVIEIQIPLEAPLKANKYPEIWSLVQEVPEKPIVNFGPKVRYTLIVQEEAVIQNDNINQSQRKQPNQKPSISISDPQNSGKVNSKILDISKQMKEILGGDIKKYIEFVKLDNHDTLPLEQLLNIYIDNQKF